MKSVGSGWDNSKFNEILKKAGIMKRNMEKKGLVRAKAKCPFCEGHWHGVLITSRNKGRNTFGTIVNIKRHLHFKCDGSCGSMMMS